MSEQSLQEQYAPRGECFGCGPMNEKGLRIRSFAAGDEVICEWQPETYHEAYPGMLNGGIIGTLMDCHCNWAAACLASDAAQQSGSSALHRDG
jgi:hypothetical protein